MKKPTLIVITGPTASGKSALAVSLAKKLDTHVINADSRQIYGGIPIATAVPTQEERKGVPHHLLEILPLDAYYSAAKFQEDAREIIDKLLIARQVAIVCGGSMLYLDALLNGIDELPTVPLQLRNKLDQEYREKGREWLLEKLLELDPVYYYEVDRNNLKRVFHAVEISLTAQVPYSSLLTKKKREHQFNRDLPFNVVKFCLTGLRGWLFDRINYRVTEMMRNGLEDEASRVYHLRHLNSLNTVGLKEMFAYFDGKFSLDEAVARIQKNTRVYAKKQMTWHKRDEDLKYIEFSDSVDFNIDRMLSILIKSRSL